MESTIEERAKELYLLDLHCNDEDAFPISMKNLCKHEIESYIIGATEQDRVARQEERERCINCMMVFRNTHNMSRYYIRPKNGLAMFDIDLFIEDIRKAMEE